MKKVIAGIMLVLAVSTGIYFVAQQANSKAVTAEACGGTDYC